MRPHKRTLRLRGAVLLCFISGALLALSFPMVKQASVGIWPFAWVALVPWLVALALANGWGAVIGSLVGGIAFYGLLLSWLWLFGWTVWALACLVLSFTLIFWALSIRWISRLSPGLRVMGTAVLWCGMEWIRGLGQFGFTWGWLGYSQSSFLPILSVAGVAGTLGISFLIALVNAALAEMILGIMQEEHPLRWLGRTVFVLTLGVLAVIGAREWKLRLIRLNGQTIQVAIIQGNTTGPLFAENVNIPTTREEHTRTLQRYLALTEEVARERPSLVVWPESALPGAPGEEPSVAETVAQAARASNAWLLVGGPYQDNERQYNSAYLYAPSGNLVARYDKVQLVPFGEYVPAREHLPSLERYHVRDFDFHAGAVHHVLQAGTVSLGPMICFESIFPQISWQLVRRGAQALIIITNDAWFGHTAAAAQHRQFAVLRAVETNRWVVRAANTGISCFISPEGRIVQEAGLFESTALTQEITLAPEGARNAGPGQAFSWLTVFLSLVFLITPAALPRRKSVKRSSHLNPRPPKPGRRSRRDITKR